MRRPENSIGRFRGSRGTELDDAGLRPYPPARHFPSKLTMVNAGSMSDARTYRSSMTSLEHASCE